MSPNRIFKNRIKGKNSKGSTNKTLRTDRWESERLEGHKEERRLKPKFPDFHFMAVFIAQPEWTVRNVNFVVEVIQNLTL